MCCILLIMIRTQVQIPDALYREAKRLADRMEISLTELVRRGLQYMVSVTSPSGPERQAWTLPPAHRLGSTDPFAAPDWREKIHRHHGVSEFATRNVSDFRDFGFARVWDPLA